MGVSVERRKHAGKRFRILGRELHRVLVGIAHPFLHRRGMPADQQCFDILLQIEISECLCRLRHFAQVAAKIITRVSVKSARARVHVNVNGAHENSL